MAQTGVRVDPYLTFNFLVELDGIAQATFRECSGLETTTEVVEHREGGDNITVRKLPGKASYGDLTLKWGLTDSEELWRWRLQVIEGRPGFRRNGSVVVYDLTNRVEVTRWNFVRAWPTKWEGPGFNALGNEVAVETVVLAHEGIVRA
jgi:phage tail-like protein